MTGNKKIRNATVCKSISGITFKSTLEKSFYKTLVENGITPEYEPTQFTLYEGFKPITPFYDVESTNKRDKRDAEEGRTSKSSRRLELKNSKIVGIRYTPDFHFKYNDIDIYIEAKGIENDVFYIKKKLFRKYLDDKFLKEGTKSIYFEIYTKKQLLQALQIIKEYGNKEGIK